MKHGPPDAEKEALVARILENPTYLPESGVVRRLRRRLLQLSKDDLAMLRIIVDIKSDSNKTHKEIDAVKGLDDYYWSDVKDQLRDRLRRDSHQDPDSASREAVDQFRGYLADAGGGDGVYHDTANYTAESVWRSIIFGNSVIRALVTVHGYSEEEAVSELESLAIHLETNAGIDLEAFYRQGADVVAKSLAVGAFHAQTDAKNKTVPTPIAGATAGSGT